MTANITGVFRDPQQAAQAVEALRSLGFGDGALQTEEKKGGLLEALLPSDERSDETHVSVAPGAHASQVRQILQQYGATRVEGDGAEPNPAETSDTLELAAEDLGAATVPVQVGEVIVRKVVVTETRTIEVPVRREEIVVERSILNEPLAAPAGNRFEQPATTEYGEAETTSLGAAEEIIRIPILEEHVTVEKHPVVREEVRIIKRRVRDVVQVSEEVRHEEPVMESAAEASGGATAVPTEVLPETDADDQPREYQ